MARPDDALREEGTLVFKPALAALVAEVQAGAGALIVSHGLYTSSAAGHTLPFCPGIILRLNPCGGDASLNDPFAKAGLPTLFISPQVAARTRSAHETLDLCAQLAAAMAAELG